MDPPPPPTPLSDPEVQALIDDQVPEADRQALLERLRHDGRAQALVARGRAQREALRGLHRALLDEPVPSTMLDVARQAGALQRRRQQWERWGGMAAGVLIAFSAGWLGRGQWSGPTTAPAGMQLAALPAFARDAALAHAVYSPEARHPVEVSASEQAHLVQWLSRRTGRPLRVPDLQAQGFGLVGGRLLPGEAGARAQFMFQNPQGVRVTLYLGAVGPSQDPAAPSSAETAFRFTDDGPVPGFYWVDQGFGYALSGPLKRGELMALAQAVYRQL